MKLPKLYMVMFINILLIALFACQNKPAEKEVELVEEGEESGTELALNEKLNATYTIYITASTRSSFLSNSHWVL